MVSNSELYDTHCHLDFSAFEGSLDGLLQDCKQANITKLLVPSVSNENWEDVQALAENQPQLAYALGLHPLFIKEHSRSDISKLRCLIADRPKSLVAIGEVGLDAEAADPEFQEELFIKQVALAEEFNLPVILHARRTHSKILSGLKKHRVRGVIHAFSGGEELLNQYVAKGISIGVGCVITRPSAKRTRDTISRAPLKSLLLETDSPDMRVHGAKNDAFGSPLAVRDVFAALCEIREESELVLAKALNDNADKLFFGQV